MIYCVFIFTQSKYFIIWMVTYSFTQKLFKKWFVDIPDIVLFCISISLKMVLIFSEHILCIIFHPFQFIISDRTWSKLVGPQVLENNLGTAVGWSIL